jgi:hypothetical protein
MSRAAATTPSNKCASVVTTSFHCIRQHTSAYVAYFSIRQCCARALTAPPSTAYDAYVSFRCIRQNTSTLCASVVSTSFRCIRQYTSRCIRQHTSTLCASVSPPSFLVSTREKKRKKNRKKQEFEHNKATARKILRGFNKLPFFFFARVVHLSTCKERGPSLSQVVRSFF